MHRYMLHNDRVVDSGAKCVSPGQVGLLSGWGVFSTIRVYDGVFFEWERHWSRMQRDAKLMRVPFPEKMEWLERRLHDLVEANQAWNATLRVVVVRNRGGLWEGPGVERDFDVIAFTTNVQDWGKSVRLGLVPHARHAASPFAGTKVLSWGQNLTWYEAAHERGFDEVVLLNERGEVAECTSANIFMVAGGRILTPPLSSGCLPGVTRDVLVNRIRVPDLEVAEHTIFPADLEQAEEIFITSTTRELLTVTEIEGLKIRSTRRAADRLQEAFSGYVEAYVAPRRKVLQ